MTYPIYDTSILSGISHPLGSELETPKKYLGGRAVTGEEYATLIISMANDTEAKAVYDFWKDDCNYGTIPFLIALPFFGADYDRAFPNTMVQFYEDIKMNKAGLDWTQSIKVKVLGTVDYLVDDIGDYLVDDSGDFLINDQVSNSNKEITWE